MRCYICDGQLNRSEIEQDATARGGWRPCYKCKQAAHLLDIETELVFLGLDIPQSSEYTRSIGHIED